MASRAQAEPREERDVVRVWREQAPSLGPLTTVQGDRLLVLYPGRHSPEAGPDFRDAVLLTHDGRLLRGDVEVHLDQRDWHSHGHHRDPRYNRVVLHVVASARSKTTPLAAGPEVPVLVLPTRAPGRGPAKGSLEKQSSPLVSWYTTLSSEDLGRVLDGGGDARFLAKSRAFGMALEEEASDEVLYRALMDALGYSQNRSQFAAVAAHVPWSLLQRIAGETAPADHVTLLEAILLGSSGLLPDSSTGLNGEAAEHASVLQAFWRDTRLQPALEPGAWHLFRVRPENHPVRRLAGIARCLAPHVLDGLAEGIESLGWDAPRAQSPTGLSVPSEGFWARWWDFHHPAPRRAPALIGASRARDTLVNVLLPLAHARGACEDRSDLTRRAFEAYRVTPALADNAITREMRRLLAPEAGIVNGARRQQGLIHLYRLLFQS